MKQVFAQRGGGFIIFLAALLSPLAGQADPLTLVSLKGLWWDEEGSQMLDIRDANAGTLTDCVTRETQAGPFTIDPCARSLWRERWTGFEPKSKTGRSQFVRRCGW